jgi:hypothetical protein
MGPGNSRRQASDSRLPAPWDRLKSLKSKGITIVLTTHYMEEAAQLCDRIVIMDLGRILVMGRPQDRAGQLPERTVVMPDECGESCRLRESPIGLVPDGPFNPVHQVKMAEIDVGGGQSLSPGLFDQITCAAHYRRMEVGTAAIFSHMHLHRYGITCGDDVGYLENRTLNPLRKALPLS